MTTIQVADQTITSEEIIPLLANYQILPKLSREVFIDRTIKSISCTPAEKDRVVQQFYQQNGLVSDLDRDRWLRNHCLTIEQAEALAVRKFKIEKFKQTAWGEKVRAYFVRRKKQLDKVVFSLIQVKKLELAQELYFRLQADEQSFAELATQYSQGEESLTGGLVSPIELGNLPPALAEVLSLSQVGQIRPVSHGELQMIVKLEKLIPAQLNPSMHQRLLNELFELWLNKQLSQLPRV